MHKNIFELQRISNYRSLAAFLFYFNVHATIFCRTIREIELDVFAVYLFVIRKYRTKYMIVSINKQKLTYL